MRKLSNGICAVILFAGIANAAPTLAGVVNSASWVPAALPNGSIAEGSLFIVTGNGMGPTTLQQASTYPLPTSAGLGGTTVQVTAGGVTNYCIMIYSSASQVAAILPSSTPVGKGTITVSYSGAQGSIPIQVIKDSFGIFAVNQQGSGPGVIDNASYQLRVPTDAAHPGDVLIIWGTGLGPITGDETVAPPQVDLGTGVQVFVGGQPATVQYGGRGSSAGLDQINFVVPNGPTGCYVSVVAKVAGVVSNFASVPIAPAGQSYCSDINGIAPAALTQVLNGGTFNTARIDLNTIDGTNAEATFQQWNYANLIQSHGLAGGPSVGSCMVYNIPSGKGIISADPFPLPGLDAGPQLNITGPNGNKTVSLVSTGDYSGELSAKGAAAFLVPGAYTVSNGAGGKDVGPFTANLTVPQPLVWTNKASTTSVSGSQDTLITWSGGGPNDGVSIIGVSGISGSGTATEFFCSAQASAGQFTIPSQVSALMPPNGIESNLLPGMDLLVGLVSGPAIGTVNLPNINYSLIISYNDTNATAIVSIK